VTSRALAFMANDRYLDWAKVFLESVRSQDAALPLYCIPHGGRMTGIAALRSAFNFEFIAERLDRLDAFGERLFPYARARHRANLRKYVALTIPVDEIAYFDIDMVMLAQPHRIFGHVASGRADLVYFATSPEWVYWPHKLDAAREMFPDMRLLSAGAFVTSREALTMDDMIGTVEDNLELFRSLARYKVFDQPVLNFVLHRLGKRCRHIAELDPSLGGMASACNPDLGWAGGRIINEVMTGDLLAVHWAGPAKSRFEKLKPGAREMRRFLLGLRQQAEQRIRYGQGEDIAAD
jgi:hypothetical protein